MPTPSLISANRSFGEITTCCVPPATASQRRYVVIDPTTPPAGVPSLFALEGQRDQVAATGTGATSCRGVATHGGDLLLRTLRARAVRPRPTTRHDRRAARSREAATRAAGHVRAEDRVLAADRVAAGAHVRAGPALARDERRSHDSRPLDRCGCTRAPRAYRPQTLISLTSSVAPSPQHTDSVRLPHTGMDFGVQHSLVLSKNPIEAVRRADSTLDARRVATVVTTESLCSARPVCRLFPKCCSSSSWPSRAGSTRSRVTSLTLSRKSIASAESSAVLAVSGSPTPRAGAWPHRPSASGDGYSVTSTPWSRPIPSAAGIDS